MFAYVNTPDFDEYLKVQSVLLLRLLEASKRQGVGFAVPVAESITINPPEENSKSHPDGVLQAEPLAKG